MSSLNETVRSNARKMTQHLQNVQNGGLVVEVWEQCSKAFTSVATEGLELVHRKCRKEWYDEWLTRKSAVIREKGH